MPMKKDTKKTIHRSSKTGQIVTEEFAETHPATTQKEEVKIGGCQKLTADFAREDLNQLRDKINEIIEIIEK